MKNSSRTGRGGFTLIELSIVLVVIGLLAGGILVGRDMIGAAAVRSQISQIDKYQAVVNTFRVKYNYLPGDIPDPDATRFGFKPRGAYAGEGDGNGIIEGVWQDQPSSNYGTVANAGETVMFWVDLSQARLIDGNFSAATSNVSMSDSDFAAVNPNWPSIIWPKAKLGTDNSVLAFSGVPTGGPSPFNYFDIATVVALNNNGGSGQGFLTKKGMTVIQSYNIDKKIDDGLPQFGSVQAMRPHAGAVMWGNEYWGSDGGNSMPEAADATTCYDNNNVSGQVRTYSITQNNGSGMNCALSFRFR